jgi:hypothetical protein
MWYTLFLPCTPALPIHTHIRRPHTYQTHHNRNQHRKCPDLLRPDHRIPRFVLRRNDRPRCTGGFARNIVLLPGIQ